MALQRMVGTPFRGAAGSALRKLVAAMHQDDAVAAGELAGRVHLLGTDDDPLGYVGKATDWYLVAWCRSRDAVRAFRTDRITTVSVTAEIPEPRTLTRADLDIPYGEVRRLSLT